MKEQSCQGCRFWKRNSEKSEMGCCRESPPVVTETETLFPDTHQLDWCGKFIFTDELLQEMHDEDVNIEP